MKRILRLLGSLVLVAALPACSRGKTLASFEGEITMHTTSAHASPTDMLVSVKGDRLRFDMKSPTGDPMHALLDPTAKKVLLFADAQKSYLDMDFATPAGQPSTNPSTSTLTQAGGHKTVAGYDCETWEVKDATGKRSDVCIAQGIAFFDVMALRPGGSPAGETPLARQFREKKSFPLESIDYDGSGTEMTRTEVVKIEKKSLDDSLFAVPPDYRKVELPKAPTLR